MLIHYEEKVGGATFAAGEVVAEFNARYVKLRHIAGTGTAEFSFDQATTHGKLIAAATPQTPNPNEVIMETEGVSQVWLKGSGETVAVTFWR